MATVERIEGNSMAGRRQLSRAVSSAKPVHEGKQMESSAGSPPSRHSATDAENNEFFNFPCSVLQIARQKERFLIFVRILLKYLEYRDAALCKEIKATIRELASFHRQQSRPQDVSLLLETYSRLKSAVSDAHWENTLKYHRMFLTKRGRQRAAPIIGTVIPPCDS
jgi:hypothetical protein